jgi:NAD(P)-dependent dehydrogenase (short-subunit alcohol dehydrogenase family)
VFLRGFLGGGLNASPRSESYCAAQNLTFQHQPRGRNRLLAVVLDVSEPAQIARSLKDLDASDGLVNCSGTTALDTIARVLCLELGSYGIRVNSVNPTVTLTPMALGR